MGGFSAEEFLRLGLKLVSNEPNEAGYRTAINRVYYACHLVGRESAHEKGWFTPKYGAPDHSGLYRSLMQRTRWGAKLRRLYELREHADYHVSPKQQALGSCPDCGRASDIEPLASDKTWEEAKSIAQDIFPRLVGLRPEGSASP